MSFFRRLYATVHSNLDQAISRIENHDAVIEAALDDLRDAIARSRVQLKQVRNQLERQQQAFDQATQDRQHWIERAKRLGEQDRTSALACLKRSQGFEQQAKRLENEVDQTQALEAQLAQRLAQLETRLSDTERQKQALAARDWTARNAIDSQAPNQQSIGIEKTLQRWEVDIERNELSVGAYEENDVLDQRLSEAERDADLNTTLDQLLAEDADKKTTETVSS